MAANTSIATNVLRECIARHVAHTSTNHNPNSAATLITGPKATGKTQLAQLLFPTYRHISLALPSEAARAEFDPAAFLSGLPAQVIIDDVHLAPRLLHHVGRVGRAGGHVLVGSRPLTLAAAAHDAFGNRCQVIRLDGLGHGDTVRVRPELTIAERMLRGGFPVLYASAAAHVGEFMRSLVADHLIRELPEQLRVDSVHDFERFLRAAALRTARPLNKAALAREVGIAGSTAAIWLDTLADAGIVGFVPAWQPPHGRPLVKAPKLYFLDTGLCAWLQGIRDAAELDTSPLAPALWETYVHGELRRSTTAAPPASWRDRTKEVDFLVPTPRGPILIDTEWSEFPSTATVGRLLRIRDSVGADGVAAVAVCCRTPLRQTLGDTAGPAVQTVGLDDLPALLG